MSDRDRRYRLRLPLHCPVMFAADDCVGEGTVVNLGVPGCAIESRQSLQAGEFVRLHLLIPHVDGSLEVPLGKVKWAKPQRFDVEFLKIPDGQQIWLRRWLQDASARCLGPA